MRFKRVGREMGARRVVYVAGGFHFGAFVEIGLNQFRTSPRDWPSQVELGLGFAMCF